MALSLGSARGTDGFIAENYWNCHYKSSYTANVATLAASAVTESEATLIGNLKSLGTARSVKVSFEYGETTSYGNTTADQTMKRRGRFYIDLTNLTAGTTYHFRAKAVGDGTTYGDDQSFTTSTSPPVVATWAASNIASSRSNFKRQPHRYRGCQECYRFL